MLKRLSENDEGPNTYQDTVGELDAQAEEWLKIETLLRKTIGRLAIAAKGTDSKLDAHLAEIQLLSREKRNEKLAEALETLNDTIASLDDKAASKQSRSDPVLLLLELLQGIKFNTDQRQQLKAICSELLISVASGKNREELSYYIKRLSALINENFENLGDPDASAIVYGLIELLNLDPDHLQNINQRFPERNALNQHDLQLLADEINLQLGGSGDASTIDTAMTTLLKRLAVVQGIDGSAVKIKSQIETGTTDAQWAGTLNEIVESISDTLKRLDEEKRELESFIINVTGQLGEIAEFVSAGHDDHLCAHEDTLSLHSFVNEGMQLIQKNFHRSSDIGELKSSISENIDLISSGVDDFVERINERHEATEERNMNLTAQLRQMEQETQELQLKLKENRKKLLYDSLTGAHSRLAYDEQIEQELARWNRYSTPFTYIMVDIDHFKRINDEFGHSAGDKALKIVAEIMMKNVRRSDYVYRIGGEEFVLLLTNTGTEAASLTVEKLRKAISATNIHFKQQRITLTVSAGITDTRVDDTVVSIFERADSALYEAKNSGRDCQIIAP